MAKSQFEIIVVNNNPSDSSPDNFFVPENCKIITESKPGSYAARNAALKIAKGEILGFTDSDCIPSKEWIQNALQFFKQNPEYSRIAGRIDLFYKSEILSEAELYEKVYAFKQDFAASIGTSVTGNMFAFKTVFEAVGSFNEELVSGGDYEWSLRAKRAGFKISYVDKVLLLHPARNEMKELIKKTKRTAAYFGKSKVKAVSRFLKYLVPPVNSLIHGKDLLFQENMIVFKIRYHLNLLRGIEEIKISFGKKANRE